MYRLRQLSILHIQIYTSTGHSGRTRTPGILRTGVTVRAVCGHSSIRQVYAFRRVYVLLR